MVPVWHTMDIKIKSFYVMIFSLLNRGSTAVGIDVVFEFDPPLEKAFVAAGSCGERLTAIALGSLYISISYTSTMATATGSTGASCFTSTFTSSINLAHQFCHGWWQLSTIIPAATAVVAVQCPWSNTQGCCTTHWAILSLHHLILYQNPILRRCQIRNGVAL